MVGNSLSKHSRQFDHFLLLRRKRHVGKFLSEYVPLFLIVGVDQLWLWSNSSKGQSLLLFIRFQFNQNFISPFSLFPGCILVNVIAACSNFSLNTVRHAGILFTNELHNVTLYYFIEIYTLSQPFFNTYKNSM